jgi:hypothetical protein
MGEVDETSIKFLILVAVVLVGAVSIMQGAFMAGVMACTGIVFVYFVAIWVRRSDEGSARVDVLDERLADLEKRVHQIEEG